MIAVNNIEKSFGKLEILKKVNLKLEAGKIYAFLGPNGSGKTTLLKCILGLVKPEKGDVLIDGQIATNDWEYRKKIGYMPQIARYPENLKVLELFRLIHNIRNQAAAEEELIRFFDLEEALHKKLKSLSGGMKQKVNAIQALMFDPPILVMDEPSVGLDPISQIKLKTLMTKARNKGKTILVTTHILSDVEELADEIIFLMDGHIYFSGSPKDLLAAQGETQIDKAIAKMTDREGYTAMLKY